MSSLAWFPVLHHLNLNYLLSFMAVAETRSFRSAAAQIHISQSALSVRVRQLEEELGVPLLHRTTRSVQLTHEGQRLYAVAKRISTDICQVALELKEEAALQRGVVTVAVLPSLASTLLPRAMKAFAEQHPGIDLRLRDVDSKRAPELVRQGDADIAVMSRNEQLHDLRFIPLFNDEFLAVVPATGHALSGRSRVRPSELAAYPLLLNPRGVDLRETLQALLRDAGVVPQPAQELIGSHALVSLVSAGFGVSILPRMALSGLDLSRCRLLRLQPRAGRAIGIVLPVNRSESPAVAAFRQFLEAHRQAFGMAGAKGEGGFAIAPSGT
jgi:LysR family carnitine catabolism transcriptional activator